MKRLFALLILFLSISFLLSACGGGSGGGGGTTPGNTTDNTGGGGGTTSPKFAGFDLSLSEGTYWEYYWTYEHISIVQGSGGSTEVDTGNFRVTLGRQAVIGGMTAYEVLVSGDSVDLDSHNYGPRWKYIAVDNNRILGSINGASLEVIFDANTDKWQGGGFFTTFSADTELVATSRDIDNEFIKTSAVRVGMSAQQTQCQTIMGYTVCTNDTAYTLSESEY